jgi:hypothetical protein
LFGTDTHVAYHEQFLENTLNVSSALSTPHSYLVEPVFTNVGDSSALVAGYIQGLVPWDRMLYNVVPEGVCGVYVVLENSCAETYTYMLNGNKVRWELAMLLLCVHLSCGLLTRNLTTFFLKGYVHGTRGLTRCIL